MQRKLVSLLGLLQAAAIVTMLFSLVTVFDFAHHNIELFSHFRLQYLAVSVLLLIPFATMRKPAYALPLVGAAILNGVYVLPWYFGATSVDGVTTLKILSANVHSSNDEYQRLLDLVGVEQPDVIFLQEFSPAWRDATLSLKGDYPYSYAEPRVDNFGIALFSRIGFDSVQHFDSPPLDYPTIVATVTLNEESVTLINTHPTIPITQFRFAARNEQINSIADFVSGIDGAVVLSGDFNLSVWCRRYRLLEERAGLRNTRRGFGVLPTWPTFMPFAMIPIDHVLVSDGIGVIETRTGERIGSDHLPLIVELAVISD